ncbi:MAG: hypothetical protein FJ288_00245 [Planctomycetes bacterium]|nr:hypothetical protein [Planctomycetota bacterium]
MNKPRWPSVALVAAAAACLAAAAPAAEQQRTCPMGREYYLYTPDNLDPAKTYWLVVGVHGKGGNGKGACGMARWAAKGTVIVAGPSCPDGYQRLLHETDKQVLGIAAALRKEFRLYPKFFIYGFSGGAQFAHRFTLKHPDQVIGCSAHSAGTWTDSINAQAASVPFAISCGENDTEKSTPLAPLGRHEWCQKFAGKLADADFYFKVRFWPGVAHNSSRGSARMTEDCFVLATTGMHEPERQAVEKELQAVLPLIGAGRFAEAMEQLRKLVGAAAAPAPADAPAAPPASGSTRPTAGLSGPGAQPPVLPTAGQAGRATSRQEVLTDTGASTGVQESSPPAAAGPAAPPADEGTRLAGLQENAWGWRENAAARAALARMRRLYVEEQAAALTRQMEKAAIEKIAAIEDAPPADAAARLDAIAGTFADNPAVAAAVAKARANLKNPPPRKP